MDRAEKAAERAAKATERAAEASDRSAERGGSGNRSKSGRSGDRNGDADQRGTGQGDGGEISDSGLNGEYGGNVVSLSTRLYRDKSGNSLPSSGSGRFGSSDDGSNSVSTDGGFISASDDGEVDESGSNSGSGSSGSDDLGDFGGSNSGPGSGPGSGGDDDDDSDDDDDDDKGRDRKFGIVPVESDESGNPYREGELVVMSDDAGLVTRAEALGFSVIEARPLESIGAVVARLRRPEGVTSNQALDLLRAREPGSASGFNYLYRTTGKVPDDPDEKRQETPAPNPPPARETFKTGAVGVIDGFSADEISGWRVERLIEKPAMAGHGDAVTGILLRDLANAYRAEPERLMLLDVMRGQAGGGAADVSALVFAFDKLVTARVGVVNLSLAGPDHPALQRAVTQSQRAGMIVVAAVGNAGPAAPPAFPAAYDGVIGVAAVDNSGKPYIYSGRGPHVDIAALGVEVSAREKGGELVGTSYAAPHVTAMIAGEQLQRSRSPVETLLAEYAEDAGAPGRDPVFGLGILTLDKPSRVAQASQSNN